LAENSAEAAQNLQRETSRSLVAAKQRIVELEGYVSDSDKALEKLRSELRGVISERDEARLNVI
jgi:hypothetical protein